MNHPDEAVKVSMKLLQDDDGSPILQISLKFTWFKLASLATKIKWASVAWQTQSKARDHVQSDNRLG